MKWIQNLKVYFQSKEQFSVNFQTNPLSIRKMKWMNEPKTKKFKDHCLWVTPEGKTDLWQKTFYEYTRDSAHFLHYKTSRNFVMEVHCLYKPVHQFDQGGLAVRIDSQNWIKVSMEFTPEEGVQLVCVVTNNGFSDASSQTIDEFATQATMRLTRTGQDFIIEAFLNQEWKTIRITHLHINCEEMSCGLYAASPKEEGFQVGFKDFKLWEV